MIAETDEQKWHVTRGRTAQRDRTIAVTPGAEPLCSQGQEWSTSSPIAANDWFSDNNTVTTDAGPVGK
jgi:hypothetical protein